MQYLKLVFSVYVFKKYINMYNYDYNNPKSMDILVI